MKKQNMCFEESLFVFRKSFFQNVCVFFLHIDDTYSQPITDHRPKQSHGHLTLSPNDHGSIIQNQSLIAPKTTGCMLPWSTTPSPSQFRKRLTFQQKKTSLKRQDRRVCFPVFFWVFWGGFKLCIPKAGHQHASFRVIFVDPNTGPT